MRMIVCAHPSFIHLGRFEIDDMTERTVRYGRVLHLYYATSANSGSEFMRYADAHARVIYSIYLSSRSMTVTAQKCYDIGGNIINIFDVKMPLRRRRRRTTSCENSDD